MPLLIPSPCALSALYSFLDIYMLLYDSKTLWRYDCVWLVVSGLQPIFQETNIFLLLNQSLLGYGNRTVTQTSHTASYSHWQIRVGKHLPRLWRMLGPVPTKDMSHYNMKSS